MVTAEVAPFSKVGGLSQVVYFLAKSLAGGHEVRVFTPKYGIIKPKLPFREELHHIEVPTGYHGTKFAKSLTCNVLTTTFGRVKTYFLENQEYYELRSNVYDYSDDHIRFFLLSRGCLEWLIHQREKNSWQPDIIHLHDWHTAYLAEDIRKNGRYRRTFYRIPILLTVHNFHLQGKLNFQYLPENERDDGMIPFHHFFHEELVKQNPLLRGVLLADWVNTVSETYTQEILTREYGEGLEGVLLKYRGKLSGILNGIDVTEFNPRTDPVLEFNYSSYNPKIRKRNKAVLQKEFGLPVRPEIPVLAYAGRLSKQKGIGTLIEVLPHLLAEFDIQMVILGSGDLSYHKDLQLLAEKYPKKIGVHLFPDFKLPRKIFAGADLVVLPSIFEPGGIVAMEAMRYGAVPVVRKTGGVADSVVDFEARTGEGNGFAFEQNSSWSLFATIARALEVYRNPQAWRQVVTNAMTADFSWQAVASEYEKLFKRVVRLRKQLVTENPHPSRLPVLPQDQRG